MLEKSGCWWLASCDFCSHYADVEEYSFQDAIDAIKKAGWKVFKKMNEWFHKCPACQGTNDGADDYEDVT